MKWERAKKVLEMSADISETFFCCRAARMTEGHTLARQKEIFSTYICSWGYGNIVNLLS